MTAPTIVTNNVPRFIVDSFELTAEERAEFDYLDWRAIEEGNETAEFIRYRGELIDLGTFEAWRNPASPTCNGWDGVRTDSYFSGLVIRYPIEDGRPDFERVIVGRYCC